jgi:hypothetical protein
MSNELSEFPELMNNIEEIGQIELRNTINDFSSEIIDLNKFQIFVNGEQANKEDLKSTNSTPGEYSQFTEDLYKGRVFTFKGKSKQKIRGEKYFLVDTGAFFSSFRVETNDKGFKIEAQTIKPKVDIIAEYGDIVGLYDENFEFICEKIFNQFCEQLISYLEL